MDKPSVIVITPTTGDEKVCRAIQSVDNQTYTGELKHLVIVDGSKFWSDFRSVYDAAFGIEGPEEYIKFKRAAPLIQEMIFNTGGNGFYGHRVFAGFAHLVNQDIVCFLDQDNWFEPDHVENIVKELEENPDANFAFSLRNIVKEEGTFFCQDNCESLGLWPTYSAGELLENHRHIDTSTYGFRTSFLRQVSPWWHEGYAADRIFLDRVREHDLKYVCTGKYTMNYRLGSSSTSPNPLYFEYGNKFMKEKYPDENYPWRK